MCFTLFKSGKRRKRSNLIVVINQNFLMSVNLLIIKKSVDYDEK